MSGEVVTVCLPPEAGADLHAALAATPAPFDMNGRHEPCQGEWDHWRLGQPDHAFMVVPRHEARPRLVRDLTPRRGRERRAVPGLCDGGPRALLDFAAMGAGAPANAERHWASLSDEDRRGHVFEFADTWVVASDHLLTVGGTWVSGGFLDDSVTTHAYLDQLAAGTLVVRVEIHC